MLASARDGWTLHPRLRPRVASRLGTEQVATGLWKPGSLAARSERAALQLALRLGVGRSLTSKQDSSMAIDLEAGADSLRELFGGSIQLAAWLGSPGPDRKYTIAAVEPRTKETLAFAKVSDSTNLRSKTLVDREAQVLSQLQGGALRGNVPELLSVSLDTQRSIMVTRAVNGSRLPPSHAFPLRALDLLARLKSVAGLEALDSERSGSLHASHGDFVPWNILVRPGGELCLIDWEFFAFRPRNWDVVHYEVQRESFFSRRPPALAARSIRRRLTCSLGSATPTATIDRAVIEYVSGAWDPSNLIKHKRVQRVRRALARTAEADELR